MSGLRIYRNLVCIRMSSIGHVSAIKKKNKKEKKKKKKKKIFNTVAKRLTNR
jgi:hypothetical protein